MSTMEWILIAALGAGAVYLVTTRHAQNATGTSGSRPYTVQYQPAVHQEPLPRQSSWTEDFQNVSEGAGALATAISRFV